MAKSDAFFIRAQIEVDTSWDQVEIDIGAFVNLGVSKSTLLRIHNVSVQYADSTGPEYGIYTIASHAARAWQLTTQSQTALVYADDKSLISSGSLQLYGDPTTTAHPVSMSHDNDINPQNWNLGYLVGVDSLFLGANGVGTVTSGAMKISIVLQVTLENATQANSVALALSQQ